MMDNMKHRTKRRAPSVIGRFAFIIGFRASINLAFGDWTKIDAGITAGMAFAGVLVYFDPPTVITYNIFTTPTTWKERLARWFK
jgi:hypothetical protein